MANVTRLFYAIEMVMQKKRASECTLLQKYKDNQLILNVI